MEKKYQIFLISVFVFLSMFVVSFFIPSKAVTDSSNYNELVKADISDFHVENIENENEKNEESNEVPLVEEKEIDNDKKNNESPEKTNSNYLNVSASSYLVFDIDSGFIFTEKNSDKRFPIASITKLMTSIITVENLDLNKSILITKEMLDVYGSTEGIEENKNIKAGDLMYPLLIESSNCAGEILSYFLGKEEFVNLMNEKAESISMLETNFADAHGLSLDNASTAEDLFQLIKYIYISYPYFLDISKGQIAGDFTEITFNLEELYNRNVFNIDPNFIGGKTGYLPEIKNTAVFLFQFVDINKNNRNIAIILLGSDGLKRDTQIIYKWLMDNYSLSPAFL